MIYYKIIPIILAIILATEGIFTGHTIVGISIVRLFEILIFLFLIKNFIVDIKQNNLLSYFMKFLLILIIFLFLKLGVLIFFKDEMAMYIFKDIFTVVIYGIIIYLAYYMISRNFKYLYLYLFITFTIFLIAFFQSELTPFTELSQNLKLQYFSQNTVVDISEKSLFSRLTGLYSYTLVLGYSLLTSSIVSIYMYIKTDKKIFFYLFIFLGIVIFLTLTRSLVLSWLVLFIFLIFKMFISKNKLYKIFIIMSLTISSYYTLSFYNKNLDTLDRAVSFTDKTTDGRIPLLITGLYTLIQNPIGISEKNYDDVKKEMFLEYQEPDILHFESHNALVNLGFKYTILGLIAFLYFMFIIIKRYLPILNKKYILFAKVTIFAYLLNGLVHNAFVFNMDFPILIFFSILAYEYNEKIKDIT